MSIRHLFAATLALCLVLSIAAARADVPGPDYAISPGDMLLVEVWGEQDLSKNYPVGPAGTINLPLVGQVSVAELTLQQAQQMLTERLRRRTLRDPFVTVSLDETASVRRVHVLGYVVQQGPVTLHFEAKVMDALAAAGTTELSDLARVQLTHPGEQPLTLDFSGLRIAGAAVPLDKVRWGDVIYVPRMEQRIAVFGQVQTPGSSLLPLGQRATVLEALVGIGGGLTPDAAASRASLLRASGEVAEVDLEALLKRGDMSQNLDLAPGDVLVVPQAENISVVGEVLRPTTFRTGEPISVLEALAQAGGFSPQADLPRAQIISTNGQVRPVDLKALWEEGDQTQNLRLAAGDVLLLPQRPPENLLVVGAVAQPGVFDLADVHQRDLLRIFTLAGRLPATDLTRVQVYRGDQRLTVNLQTVMDGDLSQNLRLEPDDVVMVPEKDMIYVLGAVAQQGKLPWDPSLTVLDAVATAGGLIPRANENGTVLVRTLPDGTSEAIPIRLGDLRRGEAPPEIALEPGDILYVPRLGDPGQMWQVLRDVLWMTGAIIGLLR